MATDQPEGYLAEPHSGQGPGVLVLHAWWGLNETVRRLCDRLAREGYVALAPDLYHGRVVDDVAAAEAMVESLDAERALAEAARAARALGERTAGTGDGLAVVGLSLGANFALALSAAAPELVRSVVLFYGTGAADFSVSRASYLGHFAEDDDFEPASGVDGLEAALRRAGRPVEFHRYPGTGHWFFEPDRPGTYDEASAKLAWERTLAFLQGAPSEATGSRRTRAPASARDGSENP